MYGMDRTSGTSLSGSEHLQQSVDDIITTRIGTRLMRRTYGCNALNRLDRPFTPDTKLDMIADIAEALNTWETRLRIDSIDITFNFDPVSKPYAYIEIEGTNTDTGADADLEIITLS